MSDFRDTALTVACFVLGAALLVPCLVADHPVPFLMLGSIGAFWIGFVRWSERRVRSAERRRGARRGYIR